MNDGEDPHAAPLLTKFLPISDGEALMAVFSGGGFGNHASCLGTVQITKTKAVPLSLDVIRLLPRLLEATVSVHDWSGQEPKVAHLISGSKYIAKRYAAEHAGQLGIQWHTTLCPKKSNDAFKPPRAPGGGDVGFYHMLELFPRGILNGEEEIHKKAEDKERTAACRATMAAAAEFLGHGLHVHAPINVLRLEYDEAEPMDMDTVDSWRWLDATWAALDWK